MLDRAYDPAWLEAFDVEMQQIAAVADYREDAWSDLALLADDPDLFDVIELARAPLSLDDDALDELPPPVPPREMPTFKTVTLPARIRTAVAQHAASVPPGFECVGRIVVDATGLGLRYDRLTNHSDEPRKAIFRSSWRPGANEYGIPCHSHPSGVGEPSHADVEWAYSCRVTVFGIWASGALKVWQAEPTGFENTHTYASVPVVVKLPAATASATLPVRVAQRRRRALFTAWPWAGKVVDRRGEPVAGGWDILAAHLTKRR